MSIMNLFIPAPADRGGLYDIVENCFPGLDWTDIKVLTSYIKARTEDELLRLDCPEKVLYEDYFCGIAREFDYELLEGSFSYAECCLKRLNLTSSGMNGLLKQKVEFEVENYGWNFIPDKYFSYAMEYGLEEYPPVDKDIEDDAEDDAEDEDVYFNAPRISREQYFHRRHRNGHNRDVARHGWQGKFPLKYANGKGWNHECKARALNASQRRLEREAWK